MQTKLVDNLKFLLNHFSFVSIRNAHCKNRRHADPGGGH
jgi:hypothetical protein